MVQLRIRRQDDDRVWYDTFLIDETQGMSVLEALFTVQEQQDGGLCFRYSYRGAVCGSCAMLINKVPRLACRIQVENVKNEQTADVLVRNEILIEPLPNMKVLRDLVVDMEHFYHLLESIQPWISAKKKPSEGGYQMSTSVQKLIETYTNCILCGICHGACPVAARDDAYLGPAALAKAWRFHLDPREPDEIKRARLHAVNSNSGVWGCDIVFRCVAVCPKKVTPTTAITAQRREILKDTREKKFRKDQKDKQ